MTIALRLAAFLAAFCCAVSAAVADAAIADDPRPNIVLIMTDDQSPIAERVPGLNEPHAFGVYGGQVYSPNIDRMAAEGIRFDQANVATPVCTASRYNYLTGRYATRSFGPLFNSLYPPGSMGRPENNVELDPPGSRPNLPQLLQAAGYRTGFVGKSHVIRHDLLKSPQNQPAVKKAWEAAGLRTYPYDADPYDPAVSAALAHNHALWSEWMKPYGFDFVDGVYSGNPFEQFLEANYAHHVEWTVSKVLNFLEGSRNSKQPFFLYFATTIPHGPHPFDMQNGKYRAGLDADLRVTPEGVSWANYEFMPARDEIRARNAAAGFPEDVAYMTWFDAGVGAILQKLEDIGADENTIVILTSDHGHWRFGKATLYEGGLRVPMIVRWPASKQSGRTYGELINSIDFAATALDLAGVTPPEGAEIDGRSYRAVLEGSDAPIQDAIFSELGSARSVKTKKWKYVAVRYTNEERDAIARGEKFPSFEGAPLSDRPYYAWNTLLGFYAAKNNPHYFEIDQLYDLEADPKEERNVIAEHPETATEMRDRLATWLRTFPQRPYGEFTRP
jgi:arylsulfatase A-like enzyme